MEFNSPCVVLEGTNPYNTMQAVVEDDGRALYLYVVPIKNPNGMLAVWVANRATAPVGPDVKAMQMGNAPMMEAKNCRGGSAPPSIDTKGLSLVWFEEGDGVALYEGSRMLAVVPGWASGDGCPGYSIFAALEAPLAWPLADEALVNLGRRVQKARDYWQRRHEEGSWTGIQQAGLQFLEERLGTHVRYWAADGGNWPPLAVCLFRPSKHPGIAIYASIGMGAQAMPGVEMVTDNPERFRRVELAIATRKEEDWAPLLLRSIMEVPWKNRTWIGDGHTLLYTTGNSDAVLLTGDPPHGPTAPTPDLSGCVDASGEPVTYLWALCISNAERAKAAASGSGKLLKDLARQGRTWVNV